MATIEDLRSEVERLTRELDLQNSEIINSAKYGLGLLEEKQSLQSKCEELENLYENTKHELEITQEVRKIIQFSSHSLDVRTSMNIPFHHR
jgi:protein bicaudal D